MGQIVIPSKTNRKRCNLKAIQNGGSLANVVLNNGEYMLIDSTDTKTGNSDEGFGVYDSYIVGDGTTACANLPINNIDDKDYDVTTFSGLGNKILWKNVVSVNGTNKNLLVSSHFPTSNTIYVIKYDYDLNNTTITIPSGCVLRFDGGSFSNGTITGNGTYIDAGNYKIFNNITFAGTFSDVLNAMWVGATPSNSSFDNGTILNTWLTNWCDYFRVISWPTGTYYFLTPSAMTADKRNKEIRGNSSIFRVNIPDVDDTGQYFLSLNNSGEYFTIKDVKIVNDRTTTIESTTYNISKTCCIKLNKSQMFSFSGVSIWYFDKAIHLIDIWYGTFSGANSLRYNRIAVYGTTSTSNEINTVDFSNLECKGISSATSKCCWPQADGETESNYNMRVACCAVDFHCLSNNCKFNGMTIEGFDYGIRFNWSPRTSLGNMKCLVNIQNCYFEANRTYDIYIGKGYVINPNNLSSYLLTLGKACITSCLFHTLKKIYLDSFDADIFSCHEDVDIDTAGYFYWPRVLHDGCVYGPYNAPHLTRIQQSRETYNDNGTVTSDTSNSRMDLERQMEEYTTFKYQTINPNTNFTSNNSFVVGNINERGMGMHSSVKMQNVLQPLRADFYNGITKAFVRSGNSIVPANVDTSFLYLQCVKNVNSDLVIPLKEFLRRWNAGTSYTGAVEGLFMYSITANPTTGIITNTSSGAIVGYGMAAIANGTYPSSNGYYFFVEGLCWIRYSYSYSKWYADHVQGGRTYNEILPAPDIGAGSTHPRLFFVSTTTRDSCVMPHVNAIIRNSTIGKLEIFTGYEWVELSTPNTRYTYVDAGKCRAERMAAADFPGQTYFNVATGITYTFWVNSTKTAWGWRTSIGNIDSLEHPNGYDATNNPLDYATELSAGECVNYQGNIYKWSGTAFVKIGGDIQIVHTDATTYSGLTTKDSNTLYAIDE